MSAESTPRTPEEPTQGLIGGAFWGAKLAEAVIYYAMHDQLTGLLIPSVWAEKVNERIEQDEAFVIAFADMDSFKKINDTLGHPRGDQLLKEFGSFIEDYFGRKEDELTRVRSADKEIDGETGRLGGDEFGILVSVATPSNRRRGGSSEKQAEKTAEHLLEAVNTFREMQDDEIKALGFDFSIGMVIRHKGDPRTATELISDADARMYTAKRAKQVAREDA